MIENGFNMRREADGTWTVFDIFNGEPVKLNGMLQTGLTENKAKDVLDVVHKDYIENHPESKKQR